MIEERPYTKRWFRCAVGTFAGAAWCALGARAAAQDAGAAPTSLVCFGGVPEVVSASAERLTNLRVRGPFLYWGRGDLWRMDPATSKSFPVTDGWGDARAIDEQDAFDVTSANELVGLDLSTKVVRTVMRGDATEASLALSPIGLDEDFVYFTLTPGPRRRAADAGLFRKRRDGTGQVEHLSLEPAGATRFLVEGGFVYFATQKDEQTVIVRRRTVAGAPEERVVTVQQPAGPLPARIAYGRVYYVDRDAIWSAPVDDKTAPTRHVETGAALRDLVVEPGCLYWTTKIAVQRAALNARGVGVREVVATKESFVQGPSESPELTTDGKSLCWIDSPGGYFIGSRIMRARRSPAVNEPSGPSRFVARQAAVARFGVEKPRASQSAVFDYPPLGRPWPGGCQINHRCEKRAAPLPRCPSGPPARRWSDLFPEASNFIGKTMRLRGPFEIEPHNPPHPSDRMECQLGVANAVHTVIGGGPEGLVLDRPDCWGDSSRLCCGGPVYGQEVVATGQLERVTDYMGRPRSWRLRGAEICEVPKRR